MLTAIVCFILTICLIALFGVVQFSENVLAKHASAPLNDTAVADVEDGAKPI